VIIPLHAAQSIEVILFDMNGTLRRREPHEPTRQAAIKRIQELLGNEELPNSFWKELAHRNTAYNQWAQENQVQLSEKEIWTRWLTPDFPRDRVEQVTEELTLAWKETRGRTLPQAGAEAVLIALRSRGYRLGVISNSMSYLDIPRSLEAFGWKDYFEVVVLSAVVKMRKPDPEIFLEATRAIKVMPARCAFVGNRIGKDVVGSKRAGFALGIIIESLANSNSDQQDKNFPPDAVIHSLNELLELFPARVSVEINT
jgi:putative hydrolase of the HAD superfamily